MNGETTPRWARRFTAYSMIMMLFIGIIIYAVTVERFIDLRGDTRNSILSLRASCERYNDLAEAVLKLPRDPNPTTEQNLVIEILQGFKQDCVTAYPLP